MITNHIAPFPASILSDLVALFLNLFYCLLVKYYKSTTFSLLCGCPKLAFSRSGQICFDSAVLAIIFLVFKLELVAKVNMYISTFILAFLEDKKISSTEPSFPQSWGLLDSSGKVLVLISPLGSHPASFKHLRATGISESFPSLPLSAFTSLFWKLFFWLVWHIALSTIQLPLSSLSVPPSVKAPEPLNLHSNAYACYPQPPFHCVLASLAKPVSLNAYLQGP